MTDQPACHLGIDLGGTKVEAAILDAAGHLLARRRIPTPRHQYEATLEAVACLWHETSKTAHVDPRIGVGIPGAISPATGLVKNANSTWLNGRPFARDLATLLGTDVRVENDANCFALSEAIDGAAAGARSVFGAILGTGVGGGIVVDGRLLRGADAIAGEWGHMPLPGSTEAERAVRPCWCGRHGCIETFLSGPALAADLAHQGCRISPDRLEAAAIEGDPTAGSVLDTYVQRLGAALAIVANLLDPDVIVLGGGLSNLAMLYHRLPQALAPHVFSDRVVTRVLPPVHGDSSGVRGAARLWMPTGGYVS